jgi:hypothetical protein
MSEVLNGLRTEPERSLALQCSLFYTFQEGSSFYLVLPNLFFNALDKISLPMILFRKLKDIILNHQNRERLCDVTGTAYLADSRH